VSNLNKPKETKKEVEKEIAPASTNPTVDVTSTLKKIAVE